MLQFLQQLGLTKAILQHYWKKVELCNSLFESLEVIGVFPFSLGNKLESCAVLLVAWALG